MLNKKRDLNEFIISDCADFEEVYYKFNANHNYFLLVTNNQDCLIGVIGWTEFNRALSHENCLKLSAAEICNRTFTYLFEEATYKDKCLSLFYEKALSLIPVVTQEMKIFDLVNRNDFFQFRMMSYCPQKEDVFLAHVLHDIPNIFYLDVGAYDPWMGSVTKWLYSSEKARGINIEPLEKCYRSLCVDRPRDINIHAAVGECMGEIDMYSNHHATTAVADYAEEKSNVIHVPVVTLAAVCEKYVPENTEIHLLKIDVEGFEKNVLQGADFDKYRPWIIVLEATRPNTMIPTHSQWEHILLQNDYVFVKQHDVNRYYLSKDRMYLANRFLDMDTLRKIYAITDIY